MPGKTLLKDGACFVTLTIAGALRGCVGHLEAIQPLYLDIMKNAVAAAFEDTRFFRSKAKNWRKQISKCQFYPSPNRYRFCPRRIFWPNYSQARTE